MGKFRRFEGSRMCEKFWNNIETGDVIWIQRSGGVPPITAEIFRVKEDEKYPNIVEVKYGNINNGDVDICFWHKNEPFDVIGRVVNDDD